MSDQFDEMAAEKLPCLTECYGDPHHYKHCPASRRSMFASLLRTTPATARREVLEAAAKAMCGFCRNQYGRGDDDQPTTPHPSKQYSGWWVHGQDERPAVWKCDAGPIWSMIRALLNPSTEVEL